MTHYADEFNHILTLAGKENIGHSLSQLFMNWRVENPKTVFFKSLVENIIGEPNDIRLVKALDRAMELADGQNSNAYHNEHHNREVFLMTLALLDTHNRLDSKIKINADMAWTTLCAALLHDYAHDGGTNRVNGAVVPMRLEQQSIDLAKEKMADLDLNALFWRRINMIVLPTDITAPDVGLPSPSAQLKAIFNGHVNNVPIHMDDMGLFSPLKRSPELALCALMVSDADLAISAGLHIDIAKNNTLNLHHETGGEIPYSPHSLQGFIQFVCDGFPASPAGKFLLSSGLNQIRNILTTEISDGVAYEI